MTLERLIGLPWCLIKEKFRQRSAQGKRHQRWVRGQGDQQGLSELREARKHQEVPSLSQGRRELTLLTALLQTWGFPG